MQINNQGLRENWRQFALLVIINGFVGGMVGLERTILPQIAEVELGLAAKSAILSFIVVFGISKALTNYYTGVFANRFGRKNLLIVGWLFGLPVPILLMYADAWSWILAANVLLGINQGFTWSSTVVMKIDLVGEKNRGLAMGFNESAGYLAVGLLAFITGWLASEYGLRPYPFYLGIGLSFLGLIASSLFVKDTDNFVKQEVKKSNVPLLAHLFWDTSWRNRNLGSVSQAGLINNLNDGMIWGLLPVLLMERGFDLVAIGEIVALYPFVWGIGQLFTGKLADVVDTKRLLVLGMLLQGVVIGGLAVAEGYTSLAGLSVLLGVGTAMVYPTFLVAISKHTHPSQRAEAIGVFRLWRDLGYAIGALLTGLIADLFDAEMAVLVVGLMTVGSAVVLQLRMDKDHST